jgi:hypothetical protein
MLRQQEAMQSEMAKALKTPFAPLAELTRKNMEMWEQMQTATRNAFKGEDGDPTRSADRGPPKSKKGR